MALNEAARDSADRGVDESAGDATDCTGDVNGAPSDTPLLRNTLWLCLLAGLPSLPSVPPEGGVGALGDRPPSTVGRSEGDKGKLAMPLDRGGECRGVPATLAGVTTGADA